MMSPVKTMAATLATGSALAVIIASALAAQNPGARAAGPASAPGERAAIHDEIDPAHPRATFTVRHMMVDGVDGSLTGVSGTILLDTADVRRSSVDVTIDATTIDTGEPRRDAHLRSDDFLDVENHPTIRFTSRSVGVEDGRHFMVGDLTLRGVTREVRIPFELRGPVDAGDGRSAIAAEGSLTIDRHDYDVSYSRLMDNGGLVVGNDVEIRLRVAALSRR